MSDIFMTFQLSRTEMSELVEEMKANGYPVEQTDIGFICHVKVRHGLALVMSALRGNEQFRVKIDPDFFNFPPVQLSELH